MAAYTSTTMDDARGIEQQLCLRGGGKERKTHLSSFFLREKCSDRCLINRRHTIMSRCFMALGPIVHCATIAFYPIVPSSRTKHTYNVPSLSLSSSPLSSLLFMCIGGRAVLLTAPDLYTFAEAFFNWSTKSFWIGSCGAVAMVRR